MSLKEIYCQDGAISILERTYLADKLGHAYIFAGDEGVGKFKTASNFAKLLLCKQPVVNKDFADSCGICQSCINFESDSHPDFVHVYKELLEFTEEGKGRKTPVDLSVHVIRKFLISAVSQRPQQSARRVFVVSESERLNTQSQNALLKVLEEPPSYCCIILLCTKLDKLLPTTKSRCQLIRFGPIDNEKIIKFLNSKGLGSEQAKFFATLAHGSLGRAGLWADLELAGAGVYDIKNRIINSLAGYRYEQSLDLAKQFMDYSKSLADAWSKMDTSTSKTDINRRASKTIISIMVSAFSDVMKLGAGIGDELANAGQRDRIAEMAGIFDPELAAGKIENCYESIRWIDASVNERLIFERLLLNLEKSDIIKA